MVDDILVFGKTETENHDNLMSVLKMLKENGITLTGTSANFIVMKSPFLVKGSVKRVLHRPKIVSNV